MQVPLQRYTFAEDTQTVLHLNATDPERKPWDELLFVMEATLLQRGTLYQYE